MRKPRQPHLVALGDLLLDVVIMQARPIERGTDVPGTVTLRRGGSAANVAAAFVRAGGSASLITSLGRDRLADRLVASLQGDGVRVRAVRRPGGSGRVAALIEPRGERSFVTQRAAADDLRPTDIKPSWLRAADILHVPAYSLFAEPIGAAALHAAAMVRDHRALVSIDLASAGPLAACGVPRARTRIAAMAPHVLFANRDEAAAVLRKSGRRAWVGLLELAPLVVVKDGARGCRILWRDGTTAAVRQLDVAAERVGRVDSTGAGDAFAAGFLVALMRPGAPDAGPDARPDVLLHSVAPDARTLAPTLRRAALAGHRSAADAMRRGRPEIGL